MEPINGKIYPMWGQFVDRKEEWIGGTMREWDNHCGESTVEKITDVRMEPNGNESALFVVAGETFNWCADVGCIGIGGGSPVNNGITIHTRFGSSLTITKKPCEHS
jgi:hypothetical protein